MKIKKLLLLSTTLAAAGVATTLTVVSCSKKSVSTKQYIEEIEKMTQIIKDSINTKEKYNKKEISTTINALIKYVISNTVKLDKSWDDNKKKEVSNAADELSADIEKFYKGLQAILNDDFEVFSAALSAYEDKEDNKALSEKVDSNINIIKKA